LIMWPQTNLGQRDTKPVIIDQVEDFQTFRVRNAAKTANG
jgi:hypothetical protein